jgi:hypothetical protein
MSNAYQNASLLVTPNGYEAGTIFSAKPTDGSGDLSFSRASTALRRNSSGLWESVANNVPRLHYPVGGGCPSWLFEPQATNLVFYSTDFQDASWSSAGGASKSATSEVSPIEGEDSTIVTTTTSFFSGLNKSITGSAGKYSIQIIAKKKDLDYIGIVDVAGGGVVGWFNLSNGTLGTISTGYSGTIEPDYNGSYRITLTRTGADQTPAFIQFMFTNTDASSSGAVGESYIFYAGVELGSVATSPIITAGSAVTRVADNINMPLSQIGGYEGTFYYEGSFIGQIEGLTLFAGSIGVNSITIGRNGSQIQAAIVGNSVFQSILSGAIPINTFCKMAVTYKSGVGCALFVNGVKYNGANLTFSSPLTDFRIGDSYWIGGRGMSLKPMGLYQTALSDSEAIALTTL